MKRRQVSNLNAGHSVIGVLARHNDALPEAAQEVHEELVELTDKIMENGRKQKTKSGSAAEKTQAANALADLGATLAGALCSYGTKVGDDRLVAACNYTRTSIVAGPDSELSSRCSDLLEEAKPIIGKLGKFKITAATLDDLKERVAAYDAVRMSPRDAIKQSAAATKRLPKLFRKMRVLLTKRLDPLIAPVKETNAELHSEYKTARKLVNPAAAPKERKSKKTTKSEISADKPQAQASAEEAKAAAKTEASADKAKSKSSSDTSKVA